MEKTKKKHLSDLHFEHKLWDMETRFYEDELKLYQNWLEEVAGKNTHMDVQVEVEHFQNQFLIQKKALSTLRHQAKRLLILLTTFPAHHLPYVLQDNPKFTTVLRGCLFLYRNLLTLTQR